MRMTMLLSSLLLLLFSCRAADSGDGDISDDAAAETWWHGGDDDVVAEPDLRLQPPADALVDSGSDNTPPTFAAPAPVSLAMGTSTTVDLALLLSDSEDDVDALTVSWSADHVALQEQNGHQLLVVAPVDWFGSEVIDLTATDSGGLTAFAPLKVIVTEVEVIDPPPPDECEPTEFALEAGPR